MNIQRFTLSAGSLGGRIQILRPIPRETRQGNSMIIDPWGDLAPLRKAPNFASLIPVVNGDVMSHALHGRMRPLMDEIGPAPEHQLIRIPAPYDRCSLENDCVMFDSQRCHPRNKKLPECWWPRVNEEVRRAMAVVTLAWAEDRYVIVVEGAEFVV